MNGRLSCVASALVCVCVASQICASPRKKVIGSGWCHNTATVDDFLDHAALYDRTGVDGVLVWLRGRDKEGNSTGMRGIWSEDWTCDMFSHMVPKLRKMTEHPAFRENFLATFRSPTNHVEWTDDAAWARVAENMRVAAATARDGGCRGLHMDCEDYRKARQFLRHPGELPYDELCALARRRGAEVFKGVFAEFPEAVILSFWFISWHATWHYGQDVRSVAQGRGDLWPSFVNGMLDVLPPSARLVDGNEYAYRFDAAKNDFAASAHRTRNTLAAHIEPENLEKYRRQMQISFGIYLDMYVNPTNSSWHFPPVEGSRLETFFRNLSQALDVADEYVWIYGERHQFVKWRDGFGICKGTKPDTWNDCLPGFNDTVASTKDRNGFGRRRAAELAASGKLRNLVQNGECMSSGDGSMPKPFGCWQPGKPENHKGRFGSDSGFGDGDNSSLCAEGVPEGCFTATVKDVKPEGLYLVRCSACGEGTSVKIAWKDAKRKWTGLSEYMPFPEKSGAWRRGSAVVRIPPQAKEMQVHLCVSLAPNEKCWFDSIEVFNLSPECTTFRQKTIP